jgi:antitoxin (DNA-binding transcriptional repressor) of toxin-antitoxin stability system
MRSYSVSEFQARCLEILEEMNRTGESFEITDQDRAVARVMPPPPIREALFTQEIFKSGIGGGSFGRTLGGPGILRENTKR